MLTPKIGHKIAFSALSILVAFFVAGFIYVYYSDHTTPNISSTVKQVGSTQYNPLPPPPKPGANASEGAALEALDSPVAPGENTAIIITTQPTSVCTISVTYNNGKSTDPALKPKTADNYGNVTWTWTVPADVQFGDWPIDITCEYHDRTIVLDEALEVKE